MVDRVVVRTVHTPPIGPRLKRAHYPLGRAVERYRGHCEAGRILAEAIEIHARGEIWASFGDRAAIGAAVGDLGADRGAREMGERA